MHFVNEGDSTSAIAKLPMIEEEKRYETIYNFAHIMMRQRPDKLCELLFDHAPNFDPLKLITSILNITKDYWQEGINFLVNSLTF